MAKNTMLALETEDASISTATITIRALQVGNKQMTQSVFRQLPYGRLVDEDAVELTGKVWGWVNYHWGTQDPDATHFVFESGSRLYKSLFPIRSSEDFRHDRCRPVQFARIRTTAYRRLKALRLSEILGGDRPREKTKSSVYTYIQYYEWGKVYRIDALRGEIAIRNHDLRTAENSEYYLDPLLVTREDYIKEKMKFDYKNLGEEVHSGEWEAEQRQIVELVERQIVDCVGGLLPTEAIKQLANQSVSDAADYCRRWDDLMQRLRAVEQLFIAA